MNEYDLDSLRLLTHQQHQQRLQEAGTERLVPRRRRTQKQLRLPMRITTIYPANASLDGFTENAADKLDA